MKLTVELATTIFVAEKRLIGPFDWQTRGRSGQSYHCLESRVDLGGSVPRGVFFRILDYPTSLISFTFQLECDLEESRSHAPLYRLDLNPINAHSNLLYGSDDVNGLYFESGETHEHDFRDSLTTDGQLRAKVCEQARRVEGPPKDFANALVRVCSRINIINGSDVPLPPSQGSLF